MIRTTYSKEARYLTVSASLLQLIKKLGTAMQVVHSAVLNAARAVSAVAMGIAVPGTAGTQRTMGIPRERGTHSCMSHPIMWKGGNATHPYVPVLVNSVIPA